VQHLKEKSPPLTAAPKVVAGGIFVNVVENNVTKGQEIVIQGKLTNCS
jgi:hypothetical protein